MIPRHPAGVNRNRNRSRSKQISGRVHRHSSSGNSHSYGTEPVPDSSSTHLVPCVGGRGSPQSKAIAGGRSSWHHRAHLRSTQSLAAFAGANLSERKHTHKHTAFSSETVTTQLHRHSSVGGLTRRLVIFVFIKLFLSQISVV